MTTPTLGFGDSKKPKFDASQLEQGGSFQHVTAESVSQPPPEQQPQFSQPPPAGVTGQMPLPVGHTVQAASLTPTERATLEKVGWSVGQAIPGNLPQLLAEIEQKAKVSADVSQLPPPGDPSTVPPLEMPKEQDIDELAPEDKARIAAALDEAQQQMSSGQTPFTPAGDGVGAAAAGVVHKHVDVNPHVIDDTDDPTYSSGEPKRAPMPDASGHDPLQPSTAKAAPQKCDHCGWDQSMPDIVEPTQEEKTSFLQALLGCQPWRKSYDLLDGQMQVTIRQLIPKEVDLCYTQVFGERDAGEVRTQLDFFEQLTRYRSCLQIVSVKSGEMLQNFPESLDVWDCEPAEGDVTQLPRIQGKIQELVVKTETLQRIVSTMVARFNRLCAKLEANVDNPDFWEAIETPT